MITADHHPTGTGGFYISPTLVAGCEPEDTLDEIFGPVAAVRSIIILAWLRGGLYYRYKC